MSDVRRLEATGEALDAAGRAAAYAYPADPPGGWWLRANMVSTLDGAAVAPDGLTRNISSTNDRALMGTLRGLSDVLLVGVGTAESEGYGPERVRPEYAEVRAANGQAPAPVVAVASAKLDLDLTGPLFRDVGPRTILLTTSSAPAERLAAAHAVADVAVVGEYAVDPASAVAALVERGHSRLLCEGGPRLLASVLAAGVLDEMCLTLSGTMLAGDAFRILTGPPLPEAPTMSVGHVLSDGADLYLRYFRTPARTS